MRSFIPDSGELTGADSGQKSVSARSAVAVPSVMDNAPNIDEEVINQQEGGSASTHLSPTPRDSSAVASAKIVPDNLADSIAYAIDGSGPGPTNDKPNVSGHKTITEGITGAGPDEEEDALWR